MATVPFEAAEVFDMVSTGDTVGVFQIESRAVVIEGDLDAVEVVVW